MYFHQEIPDVCYLCVHGVETGLGHGVGQPDPSIIQWAPCVFHDFSPCCFYLTVYIRNHNMGFCNL